MLFLHANIKHQLIGVCQDINIWLYLVRTNERLSLEEGKRDRHLQPVDSNLAISGLDATLKFKPQQPVTLCPGT